MSEESDGLGETTEGYINMVGMAASQVVQHHAYAQGGRDRARRDEAQVQATGVTARIEAQQAVGRQQLAAAADPKWWVGATGADVVRVLGETRRVAVEDPRAQAFGVWMYDTIERQYGIVVDRETAGRASADAALVKAIDEVRNSASQGVAVGAAAPPPRSSAVYSAAQTQALTDAIAAAGTPLEGMSLEVALGSTAAAVGQSDFQDPSMHSSEEDEEVLPPGWAYVQPLDSVRSGPEYGAESTPVSDLKAVSYVAQQPIPGDDVAGALADWPSSEGSDWDALPADQRRLVADHAHLITGESPKSETKVSLADLTADQYLTVARFAAMAGRRPPVDRDGRIPGDRGYGDGYGDPDDMSAAEASRELPLTGEQVLGDMYPRDVERAFRDIDAELGDYAAQAQQLLGRGVQAPNVRVWLRASALPAAAPPSAVAPATSTRRAQQQRFLGVAPRPPELGI